MERIININGIDETGLDIVAESGSDPVLEDIVKKGVGDNYSTEDHATLKLHILKTGDSYDVSGIINLEMHPECGRCLKVFTHKIRLPFHIVMAPLYEGKLKEGCEEVKECEIVKDDVDFSFFEGDSFDIAEVIREQIVLAQPMTYVCSVDCKGLCPKCGRNLNKGACGCSPEKPASPFAVLKNYKFPRKKKSSKR